MIVGDRGSIFGLMRWQQRPILIFAVSATLAVLARSVPGSDWVELPVVTGAILGGALGIFVSFRTNAAYARWWEGRQLWGRLVNLSRTFGTQVLAYLPRDGEAPSATQRRLVERQILYVHVLRCLLRDQDPWADAEVARFSSPAERDALRGLSSPTHAILDEVTRALAGEASAGRLGELRLDALDRTLSGLLDVQGGCERLKRTPMPAAYGFLADRLTRAFGILFPFTIVEETWLLVIPLNMLLATAFVMIAEVGRVLEDPFTMFWNGLPLSALSRTIETNLRERLGDRDVLPLLRPDERGILM